MAVEIQGATRATEAALVVMAATVPLTCESIGDALRNRILVAAGGGG